MSPEQCELYLSAMGRLLIAASDGVEVDGETERLRDSEFHTGARLIWLAKESNGYVNLAHDEALALCGTDAKSTLRYHLLRLRKTTVLSAYSTNGTVRAKVSGYPGTELVVHERQSNSRTASTNSRTASTNSRTASTNYQETETEREQCSRDRAAGQLLRAAGSRDRAAGQHYNRNFDDYPQQNGSMLVSQLDHLNTPEMKQANKHSSDPVEQALSYTFLLAAGFWSNTAKALSTQYPFELLRRAVGHWYTNRRSVGGKFDDKPGIVLSWLKDIEATTIPPVSAEFRASALYHRHRTKNEITEDELAAQTAPSTTSVERTEQQAAEPTEWLVDDQLWQTILRTIDLPRQAREAWLSGARLWRHDNDYQLELPESAAAHVEQYYKSMLRRTLAAAGGVPQAQIKIKITEMDK